MTAAQPQAAADVAPNAAALPPVALVIANRETPEVLRSTLAALLKADSAPTLIDVLINGNPALAAQMAGTPEGRDDRCRLWQHPLADKANAVNQYLRYIWPGGTVFFVDGYVRVRSDALRQLLETLSAAPRAHAAAALPSAGRTAAALARALQREGGLHGNLFALRDDAARRFRDGGCHVPVGMYRVDSTVGSVLSFDFDPARSAWAPTVFIAASPAASWDVDGVPAWRWIALATAWRRRLRQAQGQVENWAVRHWLAIEKRSPAGLQADVKDLLDAWQKRDPAGWRARLHASPLRALAVKRLRARPSYAALATQRFERFGGGAP